jgi:hypothetical protein
MCRNSWKVALYFVLAAVLLSAHADERSSVEWNTDWNLVATMVVTNIGPPPKGPTPFNESRIYAITNAAIHDVLNAIERRYQPYSFDTRANGPTSPEAAVAQAAHDILVAQSELSSQKEFFEFALKTDLDKVPPGPAKDAGIGLGKSAARHYLELRLADVSNMQPIGPNLGGVRTQQGAYRYTKPFDEPPLNGIIANPNWHQLKPFVLATSSQFRSPGPYPLTSAQYAVDFNEVKRLGDKASSARTAEQTEIATFWLENSPLAWNRIARSVAAAKGLDRWDSARLYALLHLAEADSYIAVKDSKDHFNAWRPVTAIHFARSDINPATIPDLNWEELSFPTPPDQEYSSGHACAGAAAAEVLKLFFGTDSVGFSMTSTSLPGKTRNYTSFSRAEDENKDSRIYAGYHFRKSVDDGETLGRKVGDYIFKNRLARISK